MDQTGGAGTRDPLKQQPPAVTAAVSAWQWGHSQVMPKCHSLQFTFYCNLAKQAPGKHWPVPAASRAPGRVCCARGASALGEEPRTLGAWGDSLSHTPNVCYLAFANPN